MDKMRIAEDSSTKLVLEKSLATKDIWHGWSRPLIMPLLFLAGSSIVLYIGSLRPWWVWIIFVGALIVEIFQLSEMLSSKRNISVTFDLQSNVATRLEKLVNGKETKNELALDHVSRILINSQDAQHFPFQTILLDSQNYPPLEIANRYDFVSFVQGSYMVSDYSEQNSLETLGRRIGELLGKPVVSKKTDYQGNTISEETILS